MIYLYFLGAIFYAAIATFVLFYYAKKNDDYANDERWQAIETRAAKISLRFYESFLLILFGVSFILLILHDAMNLKIPMVRLDTVFKWAGYLVIFNSVLHVFALIYFDKKN